MRERFEIPVSEVAPAQEAILARQGIAPGTRPPARVLELCHAARAQFADLAAPRALCDEVDAAEFAALYVGAGHNDPATPLEQIYPRAERLLLFVASLGPRISSRIAALFADNDFALASMLDAAASEGAERTEREITQRFDSGSQRALAYSPGYCGWHVSGQQALFDRLRPAEIGVTLRASFLMEPLKSISGVIVVGRPQIHAFDAGFPFCGECTSRSCRERIAAILEE